jgi:membrane-anchored glycerophosphoryl diester phosphodiesterase (GDPDase)
LAPILLVFGGLLALVPVVFGLIWIYVRLLFTSQTIIIEHLGPVQAIRRSWRLTKDFFWRTLGYVIVIGILVFVITALPAGVIQGVTQLLISDIRLIMLVNTMVETIVAVFATPFGMIAYTLMYYDLRIRKEGFDIEQQTTDLFSEPGTTGYGQPLSW